MTAHAIEVHQVFRLSAVRRPLLNDNGEANPPVVSRVSDEELVDALWRRRDQLQSRLLEEAGEQKQLRALGITAVDLEDVQPVSSVLVRLRFMTTPKKSCLASVADVSPALVIVVGELLCDLLGGPVAVSASPKPPDPEVADLSSPSTGWDRLVPFLAAVGTGVGVIGFVTFVGGIIVWARVRAAGIPAAPTLGIFPSQDLLVIGAETLLPMVLHGLLVVVVLAVIYASIRAVRIPYLSKKLTECQAAVLAREATVFGAAGMFFYVSLALGAYLVLFGLGLFGGGQLTFYQLCAGLGGVAVAALIAAAVGSVTRRFVYLATTTFVLAGLFLGTIAYWRAGNEEAIRGAAIIRDNQTAITGIFVAEAAGRVYRAHIDLDDDGEIVKRRSRLLGIANSQVTDIAIADRAPPSEALARARRLASELCRLQPNAARPARQEMGSCRRRRAASPP